MDETEFLLSTEANKKRLLQSIENVKNGTHLTYIDLEAIKMNTLNLKPKCS